MLLAAAPAYTQTLRIALRQDPDMMDPSLARTYSGRIVFAGLCDKLFDIDEKLQVVPQLALGYEWANPQTMVIHLRPNVTFQDGEPFDAAAVKYGFDRHLTFPGSFRRGELTMIDHVEVADPMTVRLVLKTPSSALLSLLTDRSGMTVAPKAAEAAGKDFSLHPVCTGPFSFTERVAQDRIVLDRYKGYWNAGAIHFDKVIYLTMPDSTVQIANLHTGNVDLAETVLPSDVAEIKADAKLKIVTSPALGYQGMMPGDPALVLAGEDRGDPRVLAQIRAELWLDRPVPVQYLHWIGNVLQGNLGLSWRTRQPVTALIEQKLPVTAQLSAMAFVIALAIGLPSGVLAAVKRNRVWDYVANVIGLAGLSTPTFWLGIMLILLVSVDLGWLPPSGYVPLTQDVGQSLATTIMPAFVLGYAIAAVLMRHTRSAMLSTLSQDYIRTARAKGLPERRVLLLHALRNALIPVVTLGALELGTLLSGAVLTEQVFSVPGFGKMVVDAVFNRDYPVVQGVVLVTATLFVLLNLLADILYVLINPRLRRA